MKTKIISKTLALIVGLLVQCGLHADPVLIHVETPGTLSTLYPDSEMYEITELKLTGNLDLSDILYTNRMSVLGVLTVVDLSEVQYYLPSLNAGYTLSEITTIILPNSITSVGGAFGQSGVVSVIIPDGVTSLGVHAFYQCRLLKTIDLPANLTNIGAFAFSACLGLTSLKLPYNVTFIDAGAFNDCSGLKEIYVERPVPPTCYSNTFAGIDKTECTLFVPPGSDAAYRAAEGWGEFENIVESEALSVGSAAGDNFNVYPQGGTLVVKGAGQRVAVYNQTGVLVQSLTTSAGNAEIQLPQKGVYVVETQLAGKTVSKKVVW